VTGGAGFIGSHLVERLLADGFVVTVLDNFATGAREHVAPDAALVEGDVSDRAFVDRLFASERFDAVFHVAGQASIRLSFATPEADLSTNVLGTLNVVRGCLDSGVGRLVNASSMTAYGEPDLVPTPEGVPCVPVSYYGVTKYAAERYVQWVGRLLEATDGESGIEIARQERPDLILMDVQLPRVSGIEATRTLRGEPATAQTPIIAITSFALTGDEQKARDAGATAYLAKPFSPRDLLGLIRSLLPEDR